MNLKHLFLVLLGALALGCTGCAGASLEVMPRLAQLDSSGSIGASSSGVSATTDLDDLGLDGDESVFGARVDADLLVAHVIVSGLQMSMSGDGTLTGDISQGGTTLPVGTTVDSSLDFDTLSVYGTFDLLPTDMWELGLGLGVTGVQFDGEITSTNVGTPGKISFNESFPVPVLAATAAVYFGPFGVSALLAGTKVSYSGSDLTYSDIDLNASWRFIDSVVSARLALGWRRLAADAEFESGGSDVEADVVFQGPYLGLSIGI